MNQQDRLETAVAKLKTLHNFSIFNMIQKEEKMNRKFFHHLKPGIKVFWVTCLIVLLGLSACQSSPVSTPTPDLSEALTQSTWRWHIGNLAQQFYPDGTWESYNTAFPAELNPLLSGKYTVEGNRVSLDVGDSVTCDPGALWVWEVIEIDDQHLEFTVVKDECPEAGADSTGQTMRWTACTLDIPEEGPVSCELTGG